MVTLWEDVMGGLGNRKEGMGLGKKELTLSEVGRLSEWEAHPQEPGAMAPGAPASACLSLCPVPCSSF